MIDNLKNLSISDLTTGFVNYHPKSIITAGGKSFQVHFKSALNAVNASKAISSLSFDDEPLINNITKVSDDSYVLQVFNLDSLKSITIEEVEKKLRHFFSTITSDFQMACYSGSQKTAIVRFSTESSFNFSTDSSCTFQLVQVVHGPMRRGIKLNLKAIIISQVVLRPSSALPVEVTVAAGPPSATAQCKKLAKLAKQKTYLRILVKLRIMKPC